MPERQELAHQGYGAPVGQEGAHLRQDTFVFRRAPVGHELGKWTNASARRDPAPARGKAQRVDTYFAKQRHQTPRPPVLDGTKAATPRASATPLAMDSRLHLNETMLKGRQSGLAFGLARLWPLQAA
jgi:hypothetical protein